MKYKQKIASYVACVWGIPFFVSIKQKISNDKIIKLLQNVLIPIGMFRHLLLSMKFWINKQKKFEDFLSIVAIVKNEAPYLQEWIEYHKLLGITKFYIYDNESNDNIKRVLKKYIGTGEVVYRRYPGKAMQCFAYNDAVNRYACCTKYMAFIDIDEFIVVRNQSETLEQIVESILGKNNHISGLGLHWKIFGSSGLMEKPEGMVIENYLRRAEDDFEVNGHIKTICNPRCCSGMGNPHYPKYVMGCYCVDDSNHKIDGAFNKKVSFEKVWINHYFTKSRQEWKYKRERGKADCQEMRKSKEFEFHDRNEVYDDTMLKYVNTLKNIIEKL